MTRAEIPVLDAATVMLVRDASSGGLEVFMLRRRLQSDFVGGAYVFPGGAVDPPDRAEHLESICAGRSDADASTRLGVSSGGLGYWVAAVRECFEEAGFLLAYDSAGRVVSLEEPVVAERFNLHRAAVDTGQRDLADVCAEESLQLAVDRMSYFSRWITPKGAPRRYDTRFFLAEAPTGQTPLHDGRETITHCWVKPHDAVEAHDRGEFPLIFPTYRSLVALSRFDVAADALAAAAAIDVVPAVEPRVVADEGGGVRILLPGDPGFDTADTPTLRQESA